jgi:hypothetical protein
MSEPVSTPPRRKHLMDPAAPRRPAASASAQRNLSRVQRWVMSTLAVTTVLHLCAGLVLAAVFLPDPRLSSQVGLNVIAAAFGVLGVAAGLAIHRRSVLSPWLLLGLLPGAVGLWLTLG